jgi:CRP-like cAMP-binding protein
MGCPQSRLADDRPVTTRDVDVRRSEPGLADAPDTAAKRTSIDDDERHEAMSDRDFEADRARLAKARKKRLAVAVEALASDAAVTVVPKDEAAARLIMRAVRDNPLFEGLPDETRAVLVSSMTRVEVPAGHDIITQGDENAEHFYVLESGAATVRVKPDKERDDDVSATTSGAGEVSASGDVSSDVGGGSNDTGPVVATLRAGDAFGELALLYRCARAATVRASFDATLWALSRDVYVTVKRARETAARAFKRELVNNVKALRALDEPSRAKIADALKKATYERNERVVRKGDPGDRFFVVADGALDVTDPDVVADTLVADTKGSPKLTPTPTLGGGTLLASLTAGDAFGERALTRRDDVRQATVTVSSAHADLYYLERDEFDELLGSYAHVRTWLAFRNVPALASVSDADLHEIARGVSTRRFNKGERVCAFGERADEMFVVESGCVFASAFGDDFGNDADPGTRAPATSNRSNPQPSIDETPAETGRVVRRARADGRRDDARHRSHRRRRRRGRGRKRASGERVSGRRRNDDAVRASPVRAGVRAGRELADCPAQRAPGVRRGRLAAAQPGRAHAVGAGGRVAARLRRARRRRLRTRRRGDGRRRRSVLCRERRDCHLAGRARPDHRDAGRALRRARALERRAARRQSGRLERRRVPPRALARGLRPRGGRVRARRARKGGGGGVRSKRSKQRARSKRFFASVRGASL